ncbi:hypothetical protein HPB51_005204 [Rhipicephalus microplus]|uniref:PiggyBac transposable element-derived protein domain-containing protein n=1 Tax=Rhipicephalus microplus TaxID=6941 RepID=A0A9J6E6G7_RHIMP|nr:hypothetical protein HPB51_005204 [Rhipicephalus microplus]
MISGKVTPDEMMKFIGLIIYVGIVKVPHLNFYWNVAIEKHGKTRRKANICAAERIFLALADGNLSDANLSDDEAEVSDDVVNVDIDFGRPKQCFRASSGGEQ